MVAAVRRGQSLRAVAQRFGVGVATVALWVQRARGRRLDRVDWADRSHAPHRTRRTDPALEDLVLRTRRHLQQTSDLGAFGAAAIAESLQAQGVAGVPSLRTLNRILARRGALDRRQCQRRPPPPRGWYLPDLAAAPCELDRVDLLEGLVLKHGPHVEVLTGISLHGGLPVSWPVRAPVTSKRIVASLIEHGREVGLPPYAPFDNDRVFQGTQRYPDALGRVIRWCLSLPIVPVLVPPRERGFQALLESYNGWWQAKVWARFQHASLAAWQQRSHRYVRALRRHRAARIEAAHERRPFPQDGKLNRHAPLKGRVIYLRRTKDSGQVEVLGQNGPVSETWPNRLVRAEVDRSGGTIRFYTLRRRAPADQPLVLEQPYQLPDRRFHE
jgi:transposase